MNVMPHAEDFMYVTLCFNIKRDIHAQIVKVKTSILKLQDSSNEFLRMAFIFKDNEEKNPFYFGI